MPGSSRCSPAPGTAWSGWRSTTTAWRGGAHLTHSTDRAVRRGKLTASEQADLLGRVTLTTKLADLADAGLVVEAVVESMKVKRAVLGELDGIVAPDAVLASNTSSLSVTELSSATSWPGRVVGVHFFNPAPVQDLVEVVRTVVTAEEVAQTAIALCRGLGKVPVACRDRAGFVVNALLLPYLNDAVRMLEAHDATADDIDLAMTRGCALPMGPFELLDVVGNDVALAIQRQLYREFREPGFVPAPLLEHLVAGVGGRPGSGDRVARRLGRGSGALRAARVVGGRPAHDVRRGRRPRRMSPDPRLRRATAAGSAPVAQHVPVPRDRPCERSRRPARVVVASPPCDASCCWSSPSC